MDLVKEIKNELWKCYKNEGNYLYYSDNKVGLLKDLRESINETIKILSHLDPEKTIVGGESGILSYALDGNGNRIPGKKKDSLKIRRFFSRKLKSLNLREFLIEEVVRSIEGKFFPELFKIRIDSGKQITQNYKDEVGGGSCMTGDCAQYTKLYEMNPTRFKQLVVTIGKQSARAIIFILDNGKGFCGRCYSDSLSTNDVLKEYASQKGWRNVPTHERVMTNLDWVNGCVPYMDNLCYYRVNAKGKLDIFNCDVGIKYQGCLNEQDGHIDSDRIECHYCEERYHEDDIIYLSNYERDVCEHCLNNNFFSCVSCDEYYHNDECHELENDALCTHCFQDQSAMCYVCGDDFYTDNMTELEEELVCNDCYQKNADECHRCENVFCIVNMYEYDGNNYCTDCMEEIEDEEERDN